MTKKYLVNKRDRFDGYGVELWLDEDNEWIAHLTAIPSISAYGKSPEAALKELAAAWNLAKESYASRGIEVPVAPGS
jgi:predicted RNase H-like HicB family nuclease